MSVTAINGTQILAGTLTNTDISATAAIAGTKISPVFGAQTLTVNTTTLVVNSADVGVGTASPSTDSRDSGSLTTTASVFLGVLAGNPATPIEGQIWYNSTTHQFMGRNNTTTVILG